MSIHFKSEDFSKSQLTRHDAVAEITDINRTFGLPTRLYAITIGAYFAFMAIMSATFGNHEDSLSLVICVVYIIMAFGVPTMWVRMAPKTKAKASTWAEFERFGINTYCGHMTATEASAQVLTVPLLILFWSIAIAVIASFVR